jgi:hypothetical protein
MGGGGESVDLNNYWTENEKEREWFVGFDLYFAVRPFQMLSLRRDLRCAAIGGVW